MFAERSLRADTRTQYHNIAAYQKPEYYKLILLPPWQ